MKKYIPIIFASIFFCSSLLIKQDLLVHIDTMSENEIAANYCMQIAIASPALLGLGSVWFLTPRQFFTWLDSAFGIKQSSNASIITILVLQIFGILMVIETIRSLVNDCRFPFWIR